MTAFISALLILLFFVIPFLAGSVYSLVFGKKDMGVARRYLSGLVILYAGLLAIQLVVVKFKFDFAETTIWYHIYFVAVVVLGVIALFVNVLRKQKISLDIIWSKKAMCIYGLIVLQGVLCIALKNPYFDNNGLLETARITLKTGTIYEYNAFSLETAVMGFPLSNKLMLLPVFYAYLSKLFGIDLAILFNFIAPTVTFVGFYLVVLLWVQRLGEEFQIKWQRLLLTVVLLTQVGDYWVETTAFRVLHTGYMGEAIFFGVILFFVLYEIKNKRYFIILPAVAAFPGLVKYDAVVDFIKGIGNYYGQATYYGGGIVLFVIAIVYLLARCKKTGLYLLNVNLTIALCVCHIWEWVQSQGKKKAWSVTSGLLITVLLILAGNGTFLSQFTQWRSNVYGADKEEYKVLVSIADTQKGDETIAVMAYAEVNQWICRLDLPLKPVVGHDLDTGNVGWYSYEVYDEEKERLWQNINLVTSNLETELMDLAEEIPIDYVVLKRQTDILPIRDNPMFECLLQSPSYTVYSVDKK